MPTTDFEILPIHLWKEPVTEPFVLMRSYYSFMDTPATLQRLQEIFTAAFDEEYCPLVEQPGTYCFFMERFESLVYAAHLLYKGNGKLQVKKEANRLKALRQAMALQPLNQPQHLTAGEQARPHKVIKAFFEYHGFKHWRLQLHQWLHHALSAGSICETANPAHLLQEQVQCYRLTEAMLLLYQQAYSYSR